MTRTRMLLVAAIAIAAVAVAATSATAEIRTRIFVVTGAGPGAGPHVRTFFSDLSPGPGSFAAYASTFRGGVDVAVGDVNGDDILEIVTGAGPGGGPHVRVFTMNGTPLDQWSFMAYGAQFTGGVRVGVADLDGDGDEEIITGPGSAGGPHVRAFQTTPSTVTVVQEFMAFHPRFTGGIDVAGIKSRNNSEADQILVGQASNGATVRIFEPNGALSGVDFNPYGDNYDGGVNVSAIDTTGDGFAIDQIFTSAATASGHVQVFNRPDLTRIMSFAAFGPGATSGADIAATPQGTRHVLTAMFRSGALVNHHRDEDGGVVNSTNAYPGFDGGVRIASAVGNYDDGTPATTTSSSTSTSSTTTTSVPA